jgi:hypothetical protein
VEAGAGDVGEGVDDCAVFGGSVSEFDIAGDVGIAEARADDVGLGDAADAGGSDGDAEACSNEGENGEPLRSFLDDVRAEAMFFAEGDGFVVGEASRDWGEEDEWLVAELRCRDDFARGERVIVGEDGDEGLGEERLDVEGFGGAAVAKEASVEDALG